MLSFTSRKTMEVVLGTEMVEKLATFLRTQTGAEATEHTRSRLRESLAAYRRAAPLESARTIPELVARVARDMDCAGLPTIVSTQGEESLSRTPSF